MHSSASSFYQKHSLMLTLPAGELTSRWARFAAVSGQQGQLGRRPCLWCSAHIIMPHCKLAVALNLHLYMQRLG